MTTDGRNNVPIARPY